MSVTILECLLNAQVNLVDNKGVVFAFTIGKEQLNHAIILLEKGYSIDDKVEPLIEEYGDIKSVPEKSSLIK